MDDRTLPQLLADHLMAQLGAVAWDPTLEVHPRLLPGYAREARHLPAAVARWLPREVAAQLQGAALWITDLDVGLDEARPDGILRPLDRARLASLPGPWGLLAGVAEAQVELRLPGDSCSEAAWDWMKLRHLGRSLQRRAEGQPAPALWAVAPHMPGWVHQRLRPSELARGCYAVRDKEVEGLWVVADELPLEEALLPFLLARSEAGRDTLARWVRLRGADVTPRMAALEAAAQRPALARAFSEARWAV